MAARVARLPLALCWEQRWTDGAYRLGVRVVPAQPLHVDAVRGCVVAAYGHYVERLGKPPAPMLDDYDDLIRRGVVYLAIQADRVLGLIVMWAESDHFFIDNIAVDPSVQGRGVGSELLAIAERSAQIAGHSELRLYTNAEMHENLAYYAQRGFVETHRASDHGYDRVFLVRRVDSD